MFFSHGGIIVEGRKAVSYSVKQIPLITWQRKDISRTTERCLLNLLSVPKLFEYRVILASNTPLVDFISQQN